MLSRDASWIIEYVFPSKTIGQYVEFVDIKEGKDIIHYECLVDIEKICDVLLHLENVYEGAPLWYAVVPYNPTVVLMYGNIPKFMLSR